MKLYTSPTAPNPRRVHVFLAEKGVELDCVQVDLRSGAHFSPEFIALNPDKVVPALVLDDGTVITESVAICRYLDAAFEGPELCGTTPVQIGLVSMWARRIELQFYQPVQDAYRNGHPAFVGRGLPGASGDVPQIPELVPRAHHSFLNMAHKLDQALSTREFVALDRFSLADIIAATTLQFAQRTKFAVLDEALALARLGPWFARTTARPSFR